MGIIYSISNFKGGTGKTSTALNLGAALAAAGKSVILIDGDAQGNLTAGLGYTPTEQPRTLANLLLAAIDYPEDLDSHLQKAIIHTDTGIDLIPANRRLADAAARLQVMQLSQYNAVGDTERSSERVMAELLEHLRPSYDYIIIDCGLKHELLTVNALAASDYCIIPVQAHFLPSLSEEKHIKHCWMKKIGMVNGILSSLKLLAIIAKSLIKQLRAAKGTMPVNWLPNFLVSPSTKFGKRSS